MRILLLLFNHVGGCKYYLAVVNIMLGFKISVEFEQDMLTDNGFYMFETFDARSTMRVKPWAYKRIFCLF